MPAEEGGEPPAWPRGELERASESTEAGLGSAGDAARALWIHCGSTNKGPAFETLENRPLGVEDTGIEPVTFGLQSRRSPS